MFFIKVILDFDAQILTLDTNLSPKTIVVISQITTSTKKKTQENIQGKCDSKILGCVVNEDAMGRMCVWWWWKSFNNQVQSVHQDKMQVEIIHPKVGFS